MQAGVRGGEVVVLNFMLTTEVALVNMRARGEDTPRFVVYATKDLIGPGAKGTAGVNGGLVQWNVINAARACHVMDQLPHAQIHYNMTNCEIAPNLVTHTASTMVQLSVTAPREITRVSAICVQAACNVHGTDHDTMVPGVHQCGWGTFPLAELCRSAMRMLAQPTTTKKTTLEFTSFLHDCGNSPEGSRGRVKLTFDRDGIGALAMLASTSGFTGNLTRELCIARVVELTGIAHEQLALLTKDAVRFLKHGATTDDIWFDYVSCGAHLIRPAEGFLLHDGTHHGSGQYYVRCITNALAVALHNRYRYIARGVLPGDLVRAFVANVTAEYPPTGTPASRPGALKLKMSKNELGAILMDTATIMARTIRYTSDTGLRVPTSRSGGASLREYDEWNQNAELIGCGDCEDAAHMICIMLMDILKGRWDDTVLVALQTIRAQYMAVLMMSSMPTKAEDHGPVDFPIVPVDDRIVHARCDMIPVARFYDMMRRDPDQEVPGTPRRQLMPLDKDNIKLAILVGEGTGHMYQFLPPGDPRIAVVEDHHSVLAFAQSKGLVDVVSVVGIDLATDTRYYHWVHDCVVCDTQNWDDQTHKLVSWDQSHFGIVTLGMDTGPNLGAKHVDYINGAPTVALHQWPRLTPALINLITELDNFEFHWDPTTEEGMYEPICNLLTAKYNEIAGTVARLDAATKSKRTTAPTNSRQFMVAASVFDSDLAMFAKVCDGAKIAISGSTTAAVTDITSYMLAPGRAIMFVDFEVTKQ